MNRNAKYPNLDKEMCNHVIKEQSERLERLKIDLAFLHSFGSTSKYVTEMKDKEIEMNMVENFIEFLKNQIT